MTSRILAAVLAILLITGAQGSAPVPPSEPLQMKPSMENCTGVYGPPVQTTLLAELYNNQMPSIDEMFNKTDTNHNNKISEDEAVESYRAFLHSGNQNTTVGVKGLNTLATSDSKNGISREAYEDIMSSLLTEKYTGCSGLCQSVADKLDRCKFNEVANATYKKQIKRQNQAKFLLLSCRLGSPDFEKFGTCVIDKDCEKVNDCFDKARHCFFGHCSVADLAVSIGRLPANSANLVAKDSYSIERGKDANIIMTSLAALTVAVPFVETIVNWKMALGLLVSHPIYMISFAILALAMDFYVAHWFLKPKHATVTVRGP